MLSAIRAAIFAAAMAVAGASSYANSPFDGHWVEDLQTQAGDAGFDKYLVANGIYKCESCRPPRTYPADGKMRPVPGDVSVISEGITVAGPRIIVTRILDREMTRKTTMTVAPDGRTATYVSLDKWPGRPKRLRTVYVAERTAPAPAGAHAVSGSWRGLRYVEVPEEYRSVDLKESNGQFTRSNFRHGHYTAKLGGNAAPVTGDGKDIYKATVRAPDAHTRIETILLNGKPLVERTYKLSADGETMTTTARNPEDGSAYIATSHRE
jgi:hypothetical protein